MGPMTLWKPQNPALGISWGRTVYVVHSSSLMYKRYTSTRVASRPSRAIQLYIAIQRYKLYSYTIHRYTPYTTSTAPLCCRRGFSQRWRGRPRWSDDAIPPRRTCACICVGVGGRAHRCLSCEAEPEEPRAEDGGNDILKGVERHAIITV